MKTDTTTRSDLDALTALNRDYIHSVQHGDVRRFDEILAEDFLCSNPDGSLVDKRRFLAQTARPVTITGLAIDDVQVRILGDVAIIHARTSYATADGERRNGRYTDVWARRGGKWLAGSAHATRLGRRPQSYPPPRPGTGRRRTRNGHAASIGIPKSSWLARFTSDRANAYSGGTPRAPPIRRKAPSCAPSPPGMMNAALRAAWPRLSRMKQSTKPSGCPISCSASQTWPAPATQARLWRAKPRARPSGWR